ncbi:family 105 glycoside hydrolase [Cryphonectria parasitica EP155]|uniref:Family 105 glycoside hydrolase n=1 Tax=Cryphonectria parasitica (strain ATCC 38755 / EP155) TaxID=660469 RepID=A0A9P5CTC3_CRYP1|nr:family 105 glycoside hydrolase [Cryphonectria parasitica EP155]KAF3769010.1 family 105 glycoside hydrolase [Cryphonectria parasitica EP155]
MADSQIKHGVSKGFNYGTAVVYKGLERAISLTKNQTLVDFYEGQMSIVQDNGTITGYNYNYSLDQYRFGMNLLYWYERTGEEKYKLAADGIRAMLHTHPRNLEGGFWHRSPTYPDQMWGDGIFMGDSFYARHTSLFQRDNTSAWDDITLQYDLYQRHCGRNATSRLLKHGYDESKVAVWADPVTGASPLVWARADGWFLTSLVETLEVMPRAHPGFARLAGHVQSLAEGLRRAQDPSTRGWWLVMDEEYVGAAGNYIESSATAMFASGLLQGVRLGFLDADVYLGAAEKAYEMMVAKWVVEDADDGTLNWEDTVEVGSLGSNASFQYYTSEPTDENDYKGIGPFMWASYEYELL